jgi:hypothetical protein
MLAVCAFVVQTTLPSYFWLEAEHLRGVAGQWHSFQEEPPPTPGWHFNGPGVSAEWGQGGESSFNSISCGAPADPHARATETVVLPHAGKWRVWVRSGEWRDGAAPVEVALAQGGKVALAGTVAGRATLDRQDEALSYWGWTFVWNAVEGSLAAGPAELALACAHAGRARRIVDVVVVTDDFEWQPRGRERPRFSYVRALEQLRPELARMPPAAELPPAGRWKPADLVVPWLMGPESFEADLPPFFVEPAIRKAFVAAFHGKSVPIFSSRLLGLVFHLEALPKLLAAGSPARSYLERTKRPFLVLQNYQPGKWRKDEAVRAQVAAARRALAGQDLGDLSGENIGYPFELDDKALEGAIAKAQSRAAVLAALHDAYDAALRKKWASLDGPEAGARSPWPRLWPGLSAGSSALAHALGAWGVRSIGLETAVGMPNYAGRLAFVRGAARQFGAQFFYYHAPNFGDTASTFTEQQNFSGPRSWFHTRYGPVFGPSIAWYRKALLTEWFAGVHAIFYEQGYDQFFAPGPGQHPVQLNPIGRVTDELLHLFEQHRERVIPVTPVALLLDPAHGFDDVEHVPRAFGRAEDNPVLLRSDADRAIAQTLDVLYYPNALAQGEPATAERQAFVHALLGDGVDVLVATPDAPVASYPVIVVAGKVSVPPRLVQALEQHIAAGATLLLARRSAPALERLCGKPRVRCADAPLGLAQDGSADPEWARAIAEAAWAAAPVHVRGDIEWTVGRLGKNLVVLLQNSRGNDKPQQGLSIAPHREQAADVTIAIRKLRSAREWLTGEAPSAQNSEVTLHVPAGAARIVELTP